MKNSLFILTVALGSFVFTSCASDEECICDDGVTITENDVKDSGATLTEACNLAQVGGASCSVK